MAVLLHKHSAKRQLHLVQQIPAVIEAPSLHPVILRVPKENLKKIFLKLINLRSPHHQKKRISGLSWKISRAGRCGLTCLPVRGQGLGFHLSPSCRS